MSTGEADQPKERPRFTEEEPRSETKTLPLTDEMETHDTENSNVKTGALTLDILREYRGYPWAQGTCAGGDE